MLLPKRSKRKPLHFFYPWTIEKKYVSFLEGYVDKLIREMTPVIVEGLKKNIVQDGIDEDLKTSFEMSAFKLHDDKQTALTIARGAWFVNKIDEWSHDELIKNMKSLFGIPVVKYNQKIERAINGHIKENADLINSLTDFTINRVRKEIETKIRQGTRVEELYKMIRDAGEVSKSRARLIARDQTNKINGNLTQLRQQSAGVTMYVWRTTGDEIVRPSHAVLNNKVCLWDNAEVYADSVEKAMKGEWKQRKDIGGFIGHPGEDFQCRCTAEMVIDDILQRIEGGGREKGPIESPAPAPAPLPPVVKEKPIPPPTVIEHPAPLPVKPLSQYDIDYRRILGTVNKNYEKDAAGMVAALSSTFNLNEMVKIKTLTYGKMLKGSKRTWLGEYIPGRDYIGIRQTSSINKITPESKLNTSVHEFGHHFEYELYKEDKAFIEANHSKQYDRGFINAHKGLKEAIEKTETFKKLTELTKLPGKDRNKKWYKYSLQQDELFARIMSQYTITKLAKKDPEKYGKALEYTVSVENHWSKEDFKGIEKELDIYFKGIKMRE